MVAKGGEKLPATFGWGNECSGVLKLSSIVMKKLREW